MAEICTLLSAVKCCFVFFQVMCKDNLTEPKEALFPDRDSDAEIIQLQPIENNDNLISDKCNNHLDSG